MGDDAGVLDTSEVLGHLAHVKGVQKILYAVSTCAKYRVSRGEAVHSTWCRDAGTCVFYADIQMKATETLPPTFMVDTPEENGLDGVKMAQMRYVRIFQHASELMLNNVRALFGTLTCTHACTHTC